MIEIVFQYSDGCPNKEKLEDELNIALDEYEGRVNYKKIKVSDDEAAKKFKFRGSPTLLINGDDFEYLPQPRTPTLNCRLYKHGIPKAQAILERLKSFG
jgi:hypothetical protein